MELKSNHYGLHQLPWLLTVVTSRKIKIRTVISPNGFYFGRFLFRIFGVKTFRNKNLSEKKNNLSTEIVRKKTFRRNDTSEYRPAPGSTTLRENIPAAQTEKNTTAEDFYDMIFLHFGFVQKVCN